MRAIFSASVVALLAFIPAQAQDIARQNAIKSLLTKPKTWTMYLEFTEATTPSDRAQRFIYEYFERDHKLMGRQVGLAFGGCDFEVTLRDDGFSFPYCPPYNGEPSLTYDPSDSQHPFKSHNPRKLWFRANE